LHDKWYDPIAAFAGTNDVPKILHLHTFGCPAYVLVNELQAKRKIDKWRPRCRVGIYLGPSPQHTSSVHLIMSPVTGHVSPQFHVSFDDFFEMIKQGAQHIQYGWHSEARIQQKSVTFYDETANGRRNLPNISILGHETTAEQPENNTDHKTGHEGANDTDHQPGNEGSNGEEIADVMGPEAGGPDDVEHSIPNQNSELPANASPREASHQVTTRSRYGWIIKQTTKNG